MKKRHTDLARRKPEGTASVRHQQMNSNYVRKYFESLKDVLDKNDLQGKPDRIWNMDETRVVLEQKPTKS